MVHREPEPHQHHRFECRDCDYSTDSVQPTCPKCGGEVIYTESN